MRIIEAAPVQPLECQKSGGAGGTASCRGYRGSAPNPCAAALFPRTSVALFAGNGGQLGVFRQTGGCACAALFFVNDLNGAFYALAPIQLLVFHGTSAGGGIAVILRAKPEQPAKNDDSNQQRNQATNRRVTSKTKSRKAIPAKTKAPKRTQKPTVIFHSPFNFGDKKSSLMDRERRG